MMNTPPLLSTVLKLSAIALISAATLSASPEKSWKRGVSANTLNSAQVANFEPGISWIYNWGKSPNNLDLNGEIEFIPMVWGDNAGTLASVLSYLEGGATPSAIFFLNEPNYITPLGSFVTPERSAAWLSEVKTTLSAFNIPIIGPHMALGGPTEDSITAFDPIQQQMVTYTTAQSFLDAYDFYVGNNGADALSLHSYSNNEIQFWVDTMFERTGEPVWVTEFAFAAASELGEMREYIVKTLDFLEHSPKVARYAWFKGDWYPQNSLFSLLNSRSDTLSPTGELYLNYPTYDPDYYYAVPSQIPAEDYITRDNMSIEIADTVEGMGALNAPTRGASSATYQVDVPSADTYKIKVHTIGAQTVHAFIETNLTIGLLGGTQIAAISSTLLGETRDVDFDLDLPAGEQTLELQSSGTGVKIDWLEISTGATWAGFPISDGNFGDTGDFIGWLSILFAPWVYSFDFNTFVYLPESAVKQNGAWMYLIRQ
tara:strand:- start:2993 stop:4447 length:1455 start_codon:yes stop_codon:yes gene_type:complete